MPTVYNAKEVYEIGIEVEKNGKAFYESAAEQTEDPDVKKFLDNLAEWENSHVALFKDLLEELTGEEKEENVFDPDNEIYLYLKAAADSHIFRKNLNISKIVSGCKDSIDILNVALQFEKDSVVLYNTVIDLVPADLGKEKVEKLIKEELSHISLLHRKLEELV